MVHTTIRGLIFTTICSVTALLVACGENNTATQAPPTYEEAESKASAKASGKDDQTEVWPTAKSPVLQNAAEIEQTVSTLLAKMTLEEKVGQITQAEIQSIAAGDIKQYHLGSILNGGGSVPERKTGATPSFWLSYADKYYSESMDDSDGFLAIPIVWGTDAVHGHNNVTGATLFPHNIGLGATRNVELIRQIGAATAREVRATGMEWVFAPTVAVTQNDLWGRTYESYSEDADLVAKFGAAMVEGLQGKVGSPSFLDDFHVLATAKHFHVLATAKHFLADGGTLGGDDQGDAVMDERELVALHSPGYVATINAGVQSIMASFSSWNGEKMHGNKTLLTDVLRGPLGFDGVVVGDWNGHSQVKGCSTESCAQSVNAGVDLMMVPNHWKAFIANTIAQVKSGEISHQRLDEAVARTLRMKLRAGLFSAGKPSARQGASDPAVVGSRAHRDLARQAVRESLVLLKNSGHLLPLSPSQHIVVSGNAADNIGRQSGGWSITWQGSENNADYPGATSIFAGIKQTVDAAGGSAELAVNGDYKKRPDVAIVVFGEAPYAEGQGDRNTLEFEAGNKQSLRLLKKFRAAGVPVVSVFISGRPMWINPEYNQSQAFVAAWLPGSEGGGVAEVLFAKKDGTINADFKGSLAFSWPNTPLQATLNPHHGNYTPLFALGYGLTYSDASEGPTKLQENVEGIYAGEAGIIDFYVQRPLQPWNVFIGDAEHKQVLSGAFAQLANGKVSLETSDKDVQEDALRFAWQDVSYAYLNFQGAPAMDLSSFAAQGVVSFDLKVDRVEKGKGGLSVTLGCGAGCERQVALNDLAWAQSGKNQWFNVSVPLTCLIQEGDDVSAISPPFGLNVGGSGEVQLANIRFLQVGQGNVNCVDRAALPTSPAMLNEYWAVAWWLPRHEQKLALAKQGDVDLVFIGDSITQGWESNGMEVWRKFYGSRKALNLGFGGDRTENVLWRLQHGELEGLNPKVAVLMIGTNNTGHRREKPEYTANGVRKIIDTLREKLPDSNILLMAIFPRSANADDALRVHNEKVNRLIAGYADDKRVFFLNINEYFLNKEGVLSPDIMPDLLHLSDTGYEIWAKNMEPTLERLLAQ